MSSRLMWVRARELSVYIGIWTRSFGRNESVVVRADLNAILGNNVMEGIVGQHGEMKSFTTKK